MHGNTDHLTVEAVDMSGASRSVGVETDEITLMGLAETIDAKIDELHHMIDRLAPALHGRFEARAVDETVPASRVPTYNRLNRADDKLTNAIERLMDLVNVVGA